MGLTFGNADKQTTATITANKQVTLSGNAVFNTPTTKGSGNIKIGQKGQLTIHNGPSSADLAALGATLSGAITGVGTRSSGGLDDLDAAIRDRIKDNLEQGKPSVVNSLGTQNWILLAAGFVALLAVVWMKRKK